MRGPKIQLDNRGKENKNLQNPNIIAFAFQLKQDFKVM